MSEYYFEAKVLHIVAVLMSGLFFSVRSMALFFSQHWPRKRQVRYVSYCIDIGLLSSACFLAFITHQFPVYDAWLNVKVTLLCLYIFLGIKAFRVQISLGQRVLYFICAIWVYGLIISVARVHHPLGIFHSFL